MNTSFLDYSYAQTDSDILLDKFIDILRIFELMIRRGFYYDYESFVPGPVAYQCSEVVEITKNKAFELYRIDDFIHRIAPNLEVVVGFVI
mgnify:CR=1 FL=1